MGHSFNILVRTFILAALLAGTFLGAAVFIHGQPLSSRYRFDSYTTDNGLPQNGVRGIAQTPDGYLWFTTFDGLVRYDGVKFTVFDKNNTKGIASNRFSTLFMESDGTLLAGTEDGGLTVYSGGQFRTYTTADGLPSNTIASFRTDVNGDTYIVTNKGNFYFRNDSIVPATDVGVAANNFSFLRTSADNWFYGGDHVVQIAADGRRVHYPMTIKFFNETLSGIRAFEDSKGNLWIGDLTGVYSLRNGIITHLNEKDGVPAGALLRPFAEDNEGGIWFSTGWASSTKVGVIRYFEGRFTSLGEEAGLSSLFVTQIFKDREGTLWVASDKGLNHLRKQLFNSYSIGNGLTSKEVYPILQTSGGEIYVGTTNGLNVYRDGRFSEVNVKNALGQRLSVTSLFEDSRKRLWIGAIGDLYLLENGKLAPVPELSQITVWAIKGDKNGSTGGHGGAININNGTLNADKIFIANATAINGGCIYNNGNLNLSNSTLAACGSWDGGGIYNEIGKTATVTNSTITTSTSRITGGGGIHNKGTLSVTNSTLFNNSATDTAVGAGIYAGPSTTINNSTITGNNCPTPGGNGGCGAYVPTGSSLSITNTTITNNISTGNQTGGVINLGTFTARNSIIAANRNANGLGVQEVSGVITSGGYNLLGSTTGSSYTGNTTGNLVGGANLAPLGNYGGATSTHALLANSSAINAGDPNNPFAVDQRGSTRPIAGRGDIGAFERNIVIDQSTIRNGNRLVPYSHQFSATRSSLIEVASTFEDSYRSLPEESNFAPTSFNLVTVSGQSLPPGLTLSATGLLAGTPTTEGVFTFTVRSIDTDGMAGANQYTIYVFSPTAASVSVSGRLLTQNGQGVRGAIVVLTDLNGNARKVTTGTFGYFEFADVTAGETYTLSVASKRFVFAPRILTVNDSIDDLLLIAEP